VCAAVSPDVQLNDGAGIPPPVGLAGLTACADLRDILFGSPEGLFPSVLSDGQHLYAWSRDRAASSFDLVAVPGQPLAALSAVPTEALVGLVRVAGAGADGALREWVIGTQETREARSEALGYGVTALAFDPYATVYRFNGWQPALGSSGGLQTGPAVVYVAGAGHLERRALESAEVTPW
jgi:hypothetical protein